MNTLKNFVRSKIGKVVLGVAMLLVLIAIVIAGGLDISGLTGTAGVGVPVYPSYPMPPGGYTCLPTCIENDAKMFIMAGANQYSMSGTPINVWIMVPGDQPTFTLGIFDGDTGKDVNNTVQFFFPGIINATNGNWDDIMLTTDTTYTLYADPLADGSGRTVLASWFGNDVMLNNAWWDTTIERNEQAKAPNGHYYYRLEVTRPMVGSSGGQAFKVRASGYLMTGQKPEWAVGLTGMLATVNDMKTVYPEYSSVSALGNVSTYNGDWQLYFYVPSDVDKITIWDAEFDRGSASALDTDDLNSEGKPSWATVAAVDEGAGGFGIPQDDNSINYYQVIPSVNYEILDPLGQPIYINNDPSGTQEWEQFTISSNPGDNPDILTEQQLKAGQYNYHIMGLDLHNFIWLGVNHPICDPNGGCPPPPWIEASCPRTIGYWKNNVQKVYIENKTSGVQETKDTLDWGLRNVALASELFRSGIDVTNPVSIDVPTPLTPIEANALLQKANGDSMLDRALQQNLAAWMNLATGKIGANSQIELTGIAGGPFSGTMMEALRFSEDVILDPAKRADATLLERAKDIADMINNNKLTTAKTEDKVITQSCGTYAKGVVPENKQPPVHSKLPKAPLASVVVPNAPNAAVPSDGSEAAAGDVCTVPATTLAEGAAILALNPDACVGQQNGLLFTGNGSTFVSGDVFSNGCLRSSGKQSVEVTNGSVEYVTESSGDVNLFTSVPTQAAPVSEDAWQLAAPDCSDPYAIQLNGQDIQGETLLAPGLYCITGDLMVNEKDTLVGSGVTLYFIDGGLRVHNGALVNLTAPFGAGVSPALPGVVIYVPGEMGKGQPLQISGSAVSYFSGIVYAPGSSIELSGTGNTVAYHSQFIGWDVSVGGSADLRLDWVGSEIPACQ